MKNTTTNMACYAAFFGPQPRDPPGNGRAPPSRPRPPKPVQPRDDGSHRSPSASYGAPQPQPNRPWPKDPGNGRQFALPPTHRVLSDKQTGGKDKPAPRPPKPTQPRDGGKKRRALVWRDPNPRDPGT